eukprot:scaffold83778_cov73-Cyclotella_meneghiniana.AAC.8
MEYKLRLGAKLMRRADFVQEIHRTRVDQKNTVLQCNGKLNAKELIDWDQDSELRSGFACSTSSRTSSTITEASSQNNTNEINTANHSKKRPHDEETKQEDKIPHSKS